MNKPSEIISVSREQLEEWREMAGNYNKLGDLLESIEIVLEGES